MNKKVFRQNSVSICHKDNCIHAQGVNADRISTGLIIAVIVFALAAIIKAFK